MKAKWIALIVTALAAVVVVGIVVLRPSAPKSETECGSCEGCAENVSGGCAGAMAAAAAEAETESVPDSTAAIVVYYFYTTQRCSNCIKIETYTHEAIEAGFADAIQNGKLIWRMINTDEPENSHYLADYKLITKSVILSDVHGGKEMRWKNLDKIWMLLRDKDEFQKYVRAEVAGFLKA